MSGSSENGSGHAIVGSASDVGALPVPMDTSSNGGSPGGPAVQLSTITWHRESHGLFDYESRSQFNEDYELQYACTVLRQDTKVIVQPPVSGSTATAPPEAEPLARLVVRNGKFCVDGTRSIGNSAEGARKGGKLWRVVKGMAGGHFLQEGDSIKLGRFKLRVRQLVPDSPHSVPQEALCTVSPSAPRLCSTPTDEQAEEMPCRICLLEGHTDEDPLIRPCECRGTIEYVHLACLRHWIRGRLDLSESSAGSYFYKPLACELCKTQYATHLSKKQSAEEGPIPPHIQNLDTTMPIVELPKTQPPFIVLERDSNRPEFKGVHVISLAEKKMLKLGRGHESDVRFADVSISRWHATVYFDQDKGKGTFVLTDHESKFGTLVAMRAPVPLDQGMTVSFQAGRTVLKFVAKDKNDTGLGNQPAIGYTAFGTTATGEAHQVVSSVINNTANQLPAPTALGAMPTEMPLDGSNGNGEENAEQRSAGAVPDVWNP